MVLVILHMRINILALFTAGTFVVGGCGTPGKVDSCATPREADARHARVVGPHYDDARIALIQRGHTTEAQLIDWFGPPERRDAEPSGSRILTWVFPGPKPAISDRSGWLKVSLTAEGKVQAYSASRGAQ